MSLEQCTNELSAKNRARDQRQKDVQNCSSSYKMTKVGVIPGDWEVIALGEVVEITSGDSPSKLRFVSSGIPYFKVEQLNNGSVYADETEYQVEESKIVKCGSLIFPKRGASILLNKIRILKHDSFMDTNLMTLTCAPEVDSFFLHSYLSYTGLDKVADTTSIPQINNKHIIPFSIPKPPLKEQLAIAEALSDINGLIGDLETLITKKHAVKTATMQQLLTGRTRLPQFAFREDGTRKEFKASELGEIPEDWDCSSFGDIFDANPTKKTLKESETVSFVGMADVTENAQLANVEKISFSSIKSGFTYFEKNDVLVAKITPCFENGKGCLTHDLPTDVGFGSTEFHVLRANESSDPRFVYFWTTLGSFRASLEAEMVGSAGHRRVSISSIQKYRIPCPRSGKEQAGIATVISDIDMDIRALEKRLDKTRQIKQGMMQELLTGKTRLI